LFLGSIIIDKMTTNSKAPWADQPFQLIKLPSTYLDISKAHVHIANEMALVHNTFFRGINAIIQQAPYVPDSTAPGYKPADVKDLLAYIQAFAKTIHHHHEVGEMYFFPEMNKASGNETLMEDPKNQHAVFHDGLDRLLEYTKATKPEDYRWEGPGGLKAIVDEIGQPLVDHLRDEIEHLLKLDFLNENELRKTWLKVEEMAKKAGDKSMLSDIIPWVLGCADKTYEGSSDFPQVPAVLPYLVKYWYAFGNGAWRFSPCDFRGKPRPLAFGPSAPLS
jgi:hemerythrin-like domain-containing protein